MEPADPLLRRIISSSAKFQRYYDGNQMLLDAMVSKMRARNWPDEMVEAAILTFLERAVN